MFLLKRFNFRYYDIYIETWIHCVSSCILLNENNTLIALVLILKDGAECIKLDVQ